MMNSLEFVKDNIIKDVKNLFKLKSETNNNKIKDIRNLFRLKKKQSKTE